MHAMNVCGFSTKTVVCDLGIYVETVHIYDHAQALSESLAVRYKIRSTVSKYALILQPMHMVQVPVYGFASIYTELCAQIQIKIIWSFSEKAM